MLEVSKGTASLLVAFRVYQSIELVVGKKRVCRVGAVDHLHFIVNSLLASSSICVLNYDFVELVGAGGIVEGLDDHSREGLVLAVLSAFSRTSPGAIRVVNIFSSSSVPLGRSGSQLDTRVIYDRIHDKIRVSQLELDQHSCVYYDGS